MVLINQETATIFCDICFDFDGVLHSYTSGWQGIDVIPDAPVTGAVPMLYHYLESFSLAIFSARSSQPEGRRAMKDWLTKHDEAFRQEPDGEPTCYPVVARGIPSPDNWNAVFEKGMLVERIQFPAVKPAAQVYVDDRAYRFTGAWPSVDMLDTASIPWYREEVP